MSNLWGKVLVVWDIAAVRFILKTVYYLLILLALLWIYGFGQTNASPFIYNEF